MEPWARKFQAERAITEQGQGPRADVGTPAAAGSSSGGGGGRALKRGRWPNGQRGSPGDPGTQSVL
jgi:hypothetical protein